MIILSITAALIAAYLSASLLWADHKDKSYEEETVDTVFPNEQGHCGPNDY